MHLPIKVKSHNNISEWQKGFNSAFKGLSIHLHPPKQTKLKHHQKSYHQLTVSHPNFRFVNFVRCNVVHVTCCQIGQGLNWTQMSRDFQKTIMY